MPVKIKSVGRGQPGVPGGGELKYYASPVMDGEMDIDALTKAIEKISTVSCADIRAVLYSLVDVAVDGLSRGAIVRMGDLGNFRISISSEGRAEPKDVNASAVKKASILFAPGNRLKEMLKNMKYTKV